ncbi:Maf family protein [Terrihabitans sp. B22-R8]|uniref:Maf family protein n=1 Tax=Terrihabitans sp. B22-R8 TaxID=3425128 RepID=UPI00403CC83F
MSDLAHPLWIEPWPLVLASASLSRAQMLRSAGIPILCAPADLDERTVEAPLVAAKSPPPDIALALAAAKALHVSERFPGRFVLGADQILAAGNELFNKPDGLAAARRQLLKLREREHRLISAAVLVVDGVVIERVWDQAILEMRAFSEEFLDRYLAFMGDRIGSSVGGYQIENAGVHLFSRVEGNHFTILGLPLLSLLDRFRARGLILE